MPESPETMLRQVLSQQAGLTAQLAAVVKQLQDASSDAREARDLGKRIEARIEEQNIVARLAEHRAESRQIVSEIRQDFVAANTLLKKELAAESEDREEGDRKLSVRIDTLEAERNKVIGVASFFSWLSRVAPWLLAGIAAFAAGLGLEDKIK